jgi:hypothetical protein
MPSTRSQEGAPATTNPEVDLAKIQETMKAMQAQIAALTAAQSKHALPVDNSALSQLSTAINPREVPVQTPETYNGESPYKLRQFLGQVDMYVNARRSLFPDDKAKILFVKTLLRGKALTWVLPYNNISEEPPAWMTDFDLFVKEITRVFGDPNFERDMTERFFHLRQTSSVSSYAVEFRHLASLLGRKEQAPLVAQFYQGLKDPIKDMMALQDEPTTLDTMVELALKIDARWQSRNKIQFRANKSAVRPNKSSFPPVPAAASAPTDVNPRPRVARFVPRPLTQEERDHRRKNNLCMYCGEEGHFTGNCPKSSLRPARPAKSAPTDVKSGNASAQV